MITIRVLSDLHLEFSNWEYSDAEEDVVVLAGDISNGLPALYYAQKIAEDFPEKHVIFITGNHEYYCGDMDEIHRLYEEELDESGHHNLHWLNNQTVEILGYTFIGGTMWCDFNRHDPLSMLHCKDGMNDFQLIKGFTPEVAYEKSQEFRTFFQQEWKKYDAKKTILVTHHLPSIQSVNPRYLRTERDRLLNGGFVTDMTAELIDAQPTLVIHGHTHDSCDYMLDETRVVCNPRGYVPKQPNKYFDPRLVITLA